MRGGAKVIQAAPQETPAPGPEFCARASARTDDDISALCGVARLISAACIRIVDGMRAPAGRKGIALLARAWKAQDWIARSGVRDSIARSLNLSAFGPMAPRSRAGPSGGSRSSTWIDEVQ